MSQTTISTAKLKAIYDNGNDAVKNHVLSIAPDLLDTSTDGFVINVDSKSLSTFVDTLDVSDYNDTRLIEVINNTASGNEAGHGFYLHKQGDSVQWYAAPTKKGKAVRIVPVFAGSDAEAHLVGLGYTQL
jgi:hypothetical protein